MNINDTMQEEQQVWQVKNASAGYSHIASSSASNYVLQKRTIQTIKG